MHIRTLLNPLILLILCVGMQPLHAESSKPAAAPQSLKPLRVAHDFWVGYAGFYVAAKMGWFQQAGLKLEEKTFSTPADGLPALLSGDVDVHLAPLDTFATAIDRADDSVRVIGLIDSSAGADAVIAGKPIATVSGLKGKTIGVSFGQTNHMLLLKALAAHKLSVKDVKLVNLNGDDAGNAFAAGKIDAAVTWEPFITQGLSKGGHVLYSTKDAPDLIINSVGVRPATLAAKRPELVAFLKALYRGTDWARKNPGEAAGIVAKALEQKAADVRDMMRKDKLYGRADSIELIGTAAAPGKVVRTTAEIITFLSENGITRRNVDAASMFDASLLPDAR
jgi:NitT/TauT family transport system substrate-binding protein